MKKIKVLDKGFVELIDVMGSDARVEQAARVSYVGCRDDVRNINATRKLIRYMMRNGHTSPFEHVHFTFAVKVPIFVWRQWIRHRTASVNEISGRYSELPEQCYVPDINRMEGQSTHNHQGSSGELISGIHGVQVDMEDFQELAFEEYRTFLNKGLAKEIARINLPLSTYTEMYWTMDLHNLFGFLAQRLDAHAQWEIQEYARAIAEIVKEKVPLSYEAFEDFRLNSVSFSGPEMEVVKVAMGNAHDHPGIRELAESTLENEDEFWDKGDV